MIVGAAGAAPEVSVVLTVFDKADALPATLASLRAQAGPAAEIVCVDDASRDGSVALLRAEAARDPMLRLIENAGNRGPAVRLNQGAAAARGRWLHLIDADDLAAPGARAFMLGLAQAHGAPLVWGRRVKGAEAAPVSPDAPARRIDRPLAFCADRPVAHMALLVERALFLAAGGADEAVFIQDQTLPLRLAALAPAMVWTDAAVCVAPVTGLSANRAQQNHDRFRAAIGALRADPPADALRPLRRLAISALSKLERETGARRLATTLAYGASKLGLPPSTAWLAAREAWAASVPGVRRPA